MKHFETKLFVVGFALMVVSPLFSSRAAPGDLDVSFSPGGGIDGSILSIVVQQDGRIVVAGDAIARLNADGTRDASFNPEAQTDGAVFAAALQSDGKVVIAGYFSKVNGAERRSIARLDGDGSLDPAFRPEVDSSIHSVALQPNGRVLVGGAFTSINGISRTNLARLNADGSVDASFRADARNGDSYASVESIALQPDGKILIAGFFSSVGGADQAGIARLNADGSLDVAFHASIEPNGNVVSMAVEMGGKVVLGGLFSKINGTPRNNVARLDMDGNLDYGFDPGLGVDGEVDSVAIESGGQLLIGGTFKSVNGVSRNNIARLNSNGSVDLTYVPAVSPNNTVNSIAVQADDKIVIGGYPTEASGYQVGYLARLDAHGSADPAFHSGTGGVQGTVLSTAPQPDGTVLIGGSFTNIDGIARTNIARLNPDGTLDSSFDPGTGANYPVWSVASQPDGKMLIAGAFTTVNHTSRGGVARLNRDGSVDTSFDPGTGLGGVALPFQPTVYSLVLQPDGKLLIAGHFGTFNGASRNRLARLNADGSLDSGFNPQGGPNSDVYSLALQPDGKAIIGGNFTRINATNRNYVARLNSDGSLDNSFQPARGADSWVGSVAVQPDGKVLIGGNFESVNGASRDGIARLNADGSLDSGFISPTRGGWPLALQPDGKVLIAGALRLNGDGTVDNTFNVEVAARVWSVALQLGGKALIGGEFRRVNGRLRWGVARLVIGDPAMITLQPVPRTSDVGGTAAFTVSGSGDGPLSYQWVKNGTNYLSDSGNLSGAATATLVLSNVQKSDEGSYSVVVSNTFGSATSAEAPLRVNRPPMADASATQRTYISGNGSDATVTLDGSRSFDPDGDLLHYAWYEAGAANPLAGGAVAATTLPVGAHPLLLVVNDGRLSSTNDITVEVLSAVQAVGRLAGVVDAQATRQQPLQATLVAALASIGRGNPIAASNQLQAFQNQVRAQVAASQPALGATLAHAAQDIIDALGGRP